MVNFIISDFNDIKNHDNISEELYNLWVDLYGEIGYHRNDIFEIYFINSDPAYYNDSSLLYHKAKDRLCVAYIGSKKVVRYYLYNGEVQPLDKGYVLINEYIRVLKNISFL